MPSLTVRILVGLSIFALLAILDLRKNGRHATRWREYAFLITCCGFAVLYGAVNDQISSRISWEYFYYGKELSIELGPQVPPDAMALSWAAAKVGVASTWSAGLIIGAAMLVTNNQRRDRPKLPYAYLLKLIPLIASVAVVFSAGFGLVGYHGGLTRMNSDFGALVRDDLWRPRRFMATFGEHLGGYVGGILGLAYAEILMLRRRAKLRSTPLPV